MSESTRGQPLLDHLVYATPDVEVTCRDLEIRLGVRASAGGQHPGRGTHNALISIGPKAYLEIIGPDPLQPQTRPVWFGVDQLSAAKLITWAVRVDRLEDFVKEISPAFLVTAVFSASLKARLPIDKQRVMLRLTTKVWIVELTTASRLCAAGLLPEQP